MNQINIEIPKGYEIDVENSNFIEGVIKFKNKADKYPKSTLDIKRDDGYYLGSDSTINVVPSPNNSTNNLNLLSTENRAKAFLALMQLIELRDAWNEIDGVTINWERDVDKHCIICRENNIQKDYYSVTQSVLSFGKRETRNLFLEVFRDLIETAKELI